MGRLAELGLRFVCLGLLRFLGRRRLFRVPELIGKFLQRFEECRNVHISEGLMEIGGVGHPDGETAQEGRMVFFTTNHIEKLDEALIRAGRMDRKFEFRPAESNAVRAQFVRFFSKAKMSVGSRGLQMPDATLVQKQASRFEQMLKDVEASHPSFKRPTLATTQVFFQTKFREPNPCAPFYMLWHSCFGHKI